MKIETPRKETLGPVGTVLHPNDLPPDRPGTRLGKNKGAEKSSSLRGAHTSKKAHKPANIIREVPRFTIQHSGAES